MAKTQATVDIEHWLYRKTQKIGTFGCFEVTIGFHGDERVDYLTYDTKGIWRAYEIKVSKADFHSGAANSFCGHYNYYAMPQELYEQVKHEIPDHVGIWCGGWIVKKPKRVEPTVPEKTLMESMIRSLARDAYRYQSAVFDCVDMVTPRTIREREKNKETIRRLRIEVKSLNGMMEHYRDYPFKGLHSKKTALDYWKNRCWDQERIIRELAEGDEPTRKKIEELRAGGETK